MAGRPRVKLTEAIASEMDFLPGGPALGSPPMLDYDGDPVRVHRNPKKPEDRLTPNAKKTVQRHIGMTRVPEKVGWREVLDVRKGPENHPDQALPIPPLKPACRKLAQLLVEVGEDGILAHLSNLHQKPSLVNCHRSL